MERYSKGRLKLLEEGLQAQISEFKVDFGDKDLQAAAKLGRSVYIPLTCVGKRLAWRKMLLLFPIFVVSVL